MTKDILLVDPGAAEFLAAAEEVFNDHILFLRVLMEELRETAGSGEKLKLAEYKDMMKELGKSANTAQHERKRLAELRKKEAGFIGGAAFDLDAARAEVCEQLDRLAAAQAEDGVS